MSKSIYYVYSNDFQSYKFNESHPFNQRRVELTTDLLKMSGALNESHIIPPRIATDEEIGLIHDPNYIEAVRKAGYGELSEDVANNYGLGTEDVPIFPNMHEASALLVGGTLTAVDLVMEGEADHALSLGGGLHHGFRGKASGFCIYNDSAIAIKYMQQKYGVKVLYIDTDAHHGDGVQWSFYDDPNVCTFSIHETGRYLFPGTGNVSEKGQGQGYGTSFNIPVDAFTEDESFLECFVTAIREVAEFFKPDVIISQNGVDSHVLDPLTHLSTTMKVYREIPKLAHQLAHEHCDGRWIAVGGGGYDHWRVVPRAWSLIWLEMLEKQDEIARGALPTEWIEKWQPKSPVKLIPTWEDPSNLYPPIPRKQEITEKNMQTMEKALQHIRSSRKKAN
ncbi:acetoin utilization protein AcuC [Schinkia azotoformans]|uniref:acetoin utilization protein AcuC n=1 Tax=Schinkia azotoformans TaxID=1454 RepID=UPI002DB98EC4|nr:acetoin utilization protein AcuC [Schinkia azotoformans]MEC1637681.1 acetoin utilization protein AcuC [Schinkia azotoformans]MEC1720519.1 acetoin utilization protein AcuC [Schinkia azotoformans]MEC1944916.1 acetoin utilization protein AcuC [Schinkia azotoformans]MED4353871.1 acetoin utilization protein AcuC [Schinkia azotoformans]MED4414055.1 acetoin utilization protein AcuC [Schinkia azotoformans]